MKQSNSIPFLRISNFIPLVVNQTDPYTLCCCAGHFVLRVRDAMSEILVFISSIELVWICTHDLFNSLICFYVRDPLFEVYPISDGRIWLLHNKFRKKNKNVQSICFYLIGSCLGLLDVADQSLRTAWAGLNWIFWSWIFHISSRQLSYYKCFSFTRL